MATRQNQSLLRQQTRTFLSSPSHFRLLTLSFSSPSSSFFLFLCLSLSLSLCLFFPSLLQLYAAADFVYSVDPNTLFVGPVQEEIFAFMAATYSSSKFHQPRDLYDYDGNPSSAAYPLSSFLLFIYGLFVASFLSSFVPLFPSILFCCWFFYSSKIHIEVGRVRVFLRKILWRTIQRIY